ncbi:alpha/beta hydrolase [Periweissella cryptocerci]|uniref:Alpha/beta hydrolase n=1 Tax=Periweissella cryptocerci TaxID=2506420 RepID=A0A4P6YRK6_9LACO|nr:alpha/beta hydrolase [Periweissella cryptocerci]QBO35232.1 alpha/beta hydrolase [Periweissella cryptocerci]
MLKKKWIKIGLGVIILALAGFLAIQIYFFAQKQQLKNFKVSYQNEIPTIYLPGLYGTDMTWGGFIQRYQEFGQSKLGYVVNVAKNGQFTEKKVAGMHDNPAIQMIFAQNAQPKIEARQLYKYLQYLKAKRGVKTVYLVGHSSGATMGYDMLVAHPNDSTIPRVQKFVSLAGDFPVHVTQAARAKVNNISPSLQVLNVGGKLWHLSSDGLVKLKEVTILRDYLPRKTAYQLVIIKGGPLKAFHSTLHENVAVDKLVAQFLYPVH